MTKKANYYGEGFKRVQVLGAPCRVPEWYGEAGNGPELVEALKPRGFKAAYYEGGHRMVIAGVAIRVAAHVKKWKAGNKAALGQGYQEFGLELNGPKKHRGWQKSAAPNLFSFQPELAMAA